MKMKEVERLINLRAGLSEDRDLLAKYKFEFLPMDVPQSMRGRVDLTFEMRQALREKAIKLIDGRITEIDAALKSAGIDPS